MNPKTILKNTFGYDEFRPLQEKIINSILDKNDSLVIMPTGGGKSLCFQIPALVFNGLTIVISPLISLMKDQVQQLTELGVSAVFLNSSLSASEYKYNTELILNNKVKLLYVAPETLIMEKTLNLLSQIKVDCITVDEAHCISEWGHDFRQEYRQISEIRKYFKDAVLTAFTATATPQVQIDIVKSLKLNDAQKFVASFNRENLYLEIAGKTNPFHQTIDFLEKYPNQSGIIYCFSRKQVDELYEELYERNYSVLPYHAGLSDIERMENQEKFIKDDVQIIVATIAFGMGINKPNVRFVIHYDLPKNIESYYQEIGRAGRDGLKAHCLLLLGYGDISKINYFIDQKNPKEKRIAKNHLDSLIRYAESYTCRRVPLLNYFGQEFTKDNCEMCDNCDNGAITLEDVTIEAQKFLSCMKRTGEFFGAMHIVDILRGSKSQKVIDKDHHLLPTYGIGKDLSKDQWLTLSRQFIQNNIIEKDIEYGSLKSTYLGRDVLKGHHKVEGKLSSEESTKKIKYSASQDVNSELLVRLKFKRKKLADKSNIPPYVIFPDKTLIEMAKHLPQNEIELENIHGVGKYKIQKYAKHFLPILIKHSTGQSVKSKGLLTIKRRKSTKKPKYIEVGEAYKNCSSLEDLTKMFGVKLLTILNHLEMYVKEGNSLDTEILYNNLELNENMQSDVFKSFEEFGVNYLKPTFDRFNESVSYEDLRILKICYLAATENITF